MPHEIFHSVGWIQLLLPRTLPSLHCFLFGHFLLCLYPLSPSPFNYSDVVDSLLSDKGYDLKQWEEEQRRSRGGIRDICWQDSLFGSHVKDTQIRFSNCPSWLETWLNWYLKVCKPNLLSRTVQKLQTLYNSFRCSSSFALSPRPSFPVLFHPATYSAARSPPSLFTLLSPTSSPVKV